MRWQSGWSRSAEAGNWSTSFVWYFHYMPVGNGAAHAGTAGIHVPSDPAFPPDHAIFHYSDSNIREKTLLECLRSPLFMAYHDGQPFNDNMLRPCPMLENPEKLRAMVAGTEAHSTDMQSPESAEHLCAKCETYAANRTPTADKLWRCCDGGNP